MEDLEVVTLFHAQMSHYNAIFSVIKSKLKKLFQKPSVLRHYLHATYSVQTVSSTAIDGFITNDRTNGHTSYVLFPRVSITMAANKTVI